MMVASIVMMILVCMTKQLSPLDSSERMSCEGRVWKVDEDSDDFDDDEDVDAKELRQFRDEKGRWGDQGQGKATAGG